MLAVKTIPGIESWPEVSQQAAQLVIDKYGEPDEVTQTQMRWHHPGRWKRIVVSKAFHQHNFPAPHIDAIECVIDYHVPVDKFTDLAAFDGSVAVERTAGEVSVCCHDEETNVLALNLMHDIVTGSRDVQDARNYYATEFTDHRRKKATPYMRDLRFAADAGIAADPDMPILSLEELKQAAREGRQKGAWDAA